MSYYLSVDGGGTKLDAVLFDDNYKLLGYGRGGSINHNFEDTRSVEESMHNCISQCLAGRKDLLLERVYVCMPGPYELFVKLLRKAAGIKDCQLITEGKMSLFAGIQQTQGIVALSGTGSVVSWVNNDKTIYQGGWGSILGDEGSAYDIGLTGVKSALKSYEQRGPYTILQEMIPSSWHLKGIEELGVKVHASVSPRILISALVPLISRAADSGDQVARSIISAAGCEMADQVAAIMKKYQVPESLPIVIAGGAWKANKIMFDAFKRSLHQLDLMLRIELPLFEPVMGGIIMTAIDHGSFNELEWLDNLKQSYHAQLYKAEWNG